LYRVLQGTKVIECGNLISAPFCAAILADVGAEVIKIEEPEHGDEARRREPFLHDIPGLERSGLFLYLNMNKLGITLNIKTTTGRKIFTELLKDANVIVENIPPKKMKEFGISYQLLKDINPSIIMTSITPFGQTGPYRDYKSCELINAHIGGAGYASTREVDISQEPIKLPAHLLSFQAGLSAAAATIGALYKWSLSGSGNYIDVSEQESVIQNLAMQLARYCYAKQIVSRTDRLDRAPFHILPCKDGYIYHAFVHEYQWRRFIEIMGNPDWADNALFKDYESRGMYWDALKPLMLNWTMEHTMEEIYRISQEKGAPIGAVYTAKEILNSRQLAARGFIVQSEHQECGNLKYPDAPYKFSGIPFEEPAPAPFLGQHNEEIYCGRLGYSKHDLVKLKQGGVI
jgi:crotonobetainyl-CoA:carnitine CoA-transferase CaiB-like acyl-CoA transferase